MELIAHSSLKDIYNCTLIHVLFKIYMYTKCTSKCIGIDTSTELFIR